MLSEIRQRRTNTIWFQHMWTLKKKKPKKQKTKKTRPKLTHRNRDQTDGCQSEGEWRVGQVGEEEYNQWYCNKFAWRQKIIRLHETVTLEEILMWSHYIIDLKLMEYCMPAILKNKQTLECFYEVRFANGLESFLWAVRIIWILGRLWITTYNFE